MNKLMTVSLALIATFAFACSATEDSLEEDERASAEQSQMKGDPSKASAKDDDKSKPADKKSAPEKTTDGKGGDKGKPIGDDADKKPTGKGDIDKQPVKDSPCGCQDKGDDYADDKGDEDPKGKGGVKGK